MAPRSCKFGKVKSGPRKGKCRKHKVAARHKRPVTGAAAKAQRCKGNKGADFKACMSSSLHGLGGMRRRRKSRR